MSLFDRKEGVNVRIENITPQRAKELLATNTANRKLDTKAVNMIANAIKDGRFLTTNNGIGVDKNGILTDGQHRLTAIIRANIPANIAVFTGLEPKTRILIDTGKKRTLSNQLQICDLGFGTDDKGCKINLTPTISQAALYCVLHIKGSKDITNATKYSISSDIITDFVSANNEDLVNSALFIKGELKNAKYLKQGIILYLYQMCKFVDEEKIIKFINILTGKVLSEDPSTCPAEKLKYTLMDNAIKTRGKLRTNEELSICIDGCNKFMSDTKLGDKYKKLTSRIRKDGMVTLTIDKTKLSEKGIEFLNSVSVDEVIENV